MSNDDRELEQLKKRAARARRSPARTRRTEDTSASASRRRPGGFIRYLRLVTPAAAKWITLLLGTAIFFAGFAFGKKGPTFYLVVGSAYGGAILLYLLGRALGYLRFCAWHRRPPFTLEGWRLLANDSKLFDEDYWRALTISVRMKKDASREEVVLANAALEIFRDQVNRRYLHTLQRRGDGRQPWAFTTPTTLQGSANADVVRWVWRSCHTDLSLVARRTGAVEGVVLEVGEQVSYIREVDPTNPMM